ncbi:MAG: hypothetical protein HWE20_01825, partial [Gammaproteobacteria bacterium]|nr:hypothetical protein [Gammaproteobacteria bacterium]
MTKTTMQITDTPLPKNATWPSAACLQHLLVSALLSLLILVLPARADMSIGWVASTNGSPTGRTIAELLGTSTIQTDPSFGVAVKGVDTQNVGSWQYLAAGNWSDFPSNVSDNAAVLIENTDAIRFVPNSTADGEPTLTVVSWDGSGGQNNIAFATGDVVDLTADISSFTNSPSADIFGAQSELVVVQVAHRDDPAGAPELIVRPEITGVPYTSNTLSVSDGIWFAQNNLSFSYRWLVDGVEKGTANTYQVTAADQGKSLHAEVTATVDGKMTTVETAELNYFSPNHLDGLVVWHDGKDANSITLGANGVTEWKSLVSSNHLSLVSGTGITYEDQGLRLTGQHLQAPGSLNGDGSELTFFVAYRENTRSQNLAINFNGTDTDRTRYSMHLPWSSGALFFDPGQIFGGTSRSYGMTTDTAGPFSIASMQNSVLEDRRFIKYNGSFIDQDVVGVAGATSSLYVGESVSDHVFYELIAFNRALSEDEVLQVEGYLAHRWGKTAQFQTDFAYLDAAPVQSVQPRIQVVSAPSEITESTVLPMAIQLSSAPEQDVTVSISVDNSSIAVSPLSLTFTVSNWNQPQSVLLSSTERTTPTPQSVQMALAGAGLVTQTVSIDVVNLNRLGELTLSGNLIEGQTLVASVVDLDGTTSGNLSYQWLRDGVAIEGATGTQYSLTLPDIGAVISVSADYTDDQGSAESLVQSSTQVIANRNDLPVLTLTGSAEQGQTLSTDLTDLDGISGAVNYRWYRGSTEITGETESSYTLTQADVGATVSVSVAYTDDFGTAETATRATSSAVGNINDLSSVAINGVAEEDQLLSATVSDPDGLGDVINYQWQRDGVAIAGATSSSYRLGDDDVDAQISVETTFTDGFGYAESATAAVGPVANVNDAPVVNAPLSIAYGVEGRNFVWSLPAGVFDDFDGDALSISFNIPADMAWLSVSEQTLSGTPTPGDLGGEVEVVAQDPDGASISATLSVVIRPTPIKLVQPLSTTQTSGYVVYTFDATDALGNALTYSIDAGNDASEFALSGTELTLATQIAYPSSGNDGIMSRSLDILVTYANGDNEIWELSIPLYRSATPEILVDFPDTVVALEDAVTLALPQQLASVTAIKTQGRGEYASQWITQFELHWLYADGSMAPVTNPVSGDVQFTGNSDKHTIIDHALNAPLSGQPVALRLVPLYGNGSENSFGLRSALVLDDREGIYNPLSYQRGYSDIYYTYRAYTNHSYGTLNTTGYSWLSSTRISVPDDFMDYPLPQGVFFDADSTDLSVGVTGLPAGLAYDPAAQAIVGQATESGDFVVDVTVTDPEGNAATKRFTLTVTARNAVNLMQGALATQSDTLYGANASRAIDGNPMADPQLYSTTFAPAQADGAWWQADIGQSVWLDDLEIRVASIDAARGSNLIIYLADKDLSAMSVAALDSDASVTRYTIDATTTPTLALDSPARYIKIVQGNVGEPLELAEVIVLNNDLSLGSPIPAQTVAEDQTLSFTLPADAFVDTESLSVQASNLGAWITFNGTDTLTASPLEGQLGTQVVSLTATDSLGQSVSTTVTFTATAVNDAPTVKSQVADQSVFEDALFSLPLSVDALFADADGDSLSLSAQLPDWLTLDANNVLSGTPSQANVGAHTIMLSAADASESVSQQFTLTVVNVNDAPVISGQPAIAVNEDSVYSFTPSVADDDGDALNFSIQNKPRWATFDATSGQLSGTPTNDDVGVVQNIVVSVSDGQITRSLASFNLQVLNTQDAPVIAGTPATTVDEDSTYSFTPTASDDDGDALIFSITNKPSWASFDVNTGALTGTPANGHVGSTTGIVISVSDGTDTVALAAFDLEVVNTQDSPVISGTPATSVDEDSAYSFTPTASDDDGDTLTFSIANKPTWANFDSSTGTLSGTPVDADV